MDSSLIFSNTLTRLILFFFVSLTVVFLKSDLAISSPIPKLFSLCVALAIGFQDGHGLHQSWDTHTAMVLTTAVAIAAVVALNHDRKSSQNKSDWNELLRASCLNRAVFLLADGLLIRLMAFLSLGLAAARRSQIRRTFLTGFSVLIPTCMALLGVAIAALLGINPGNALLFSVLCVSASYLADPAAMRLTVPEVNPSLYILMTLALTSPFNSIIGIPTYFQSIQNFWG